MAGFSLYFRPAYTRPRKSNLGRPGALSRAHHSQGKVRPESRIFKESFTMVKL